VLLPYTIEVYFASLSAYNNDLIWALPLVFFIAGGILVALLLQVRNLSLIYLSLAAMCLSIGVGHQWILMGPLNFMAPVYAVAWAVAALALAVMGTRAPALGEASNAERVVGFSLMGMGGLVFPAAIGGWLDDWAAVPLVGIAPDPTALFVLGALLVLRAPLGLFLLPLGWAGVSMVSGYLLDFWGDYAVAGLLFAGLAARLVRR